MDISFVAANALLGQTIALAMPTFETADLTPALNDLDRSTDGAVARAIAGSRFKGAAGQSLDLVAPHGLEVSRLVLIGTGGKIELDAGGAETFAAQAYGAVKTSGAEVLALNLAGHSAEVCAHAVLGFRLAAYRFDKYRTTQKPEAKPSIIFLSTVILSLAFVFEDRFIPPSLSCSINDATGSLRRNESGEGHVLEVRAHDRSI